MLENLANIGQMPTPKSRCYWILQPVVKPVRTSDLTPEDDSREHGLTSEKEQVIEAVEFFLEGANSEARQAITNAFEKSGLQLRTDQTGGES